MESFKIFMLQLLLVALFCGISSSSGQFPPLKEEYVEIPPLSELVKDFVEWVENIPAKNFSESDYSKLDTNCQFSTIKGRRLYQEDRVSCDVDLLIPFHGYYRIKMVRVGLVAVFDGHIGEQASQMVSERFLSNFHSYLYKYHYPSERFLLAKPGPETLGSVSESFPDHKKVLKNALLQTFKNVDFAFTQEAKKHNLAAGTTAVVVLLVDNQILVANVGDSKALLCSKNDTQPSEEGTRILNYPVSPVNGMEYGPVQLSPKELTRDHNALRDDERARIEAAGGVIITTDDWKVPLVMGHFPMTRAIGDLPLKRYGIISEPEVTPWLPISSNDVYLVVASDGIFERLSPKDVCNLLQGGNKPFLAAQQQPVPASELIIQTAYEKGSQDNLSVVVVPLNYL